MSYQPVSGIVPQYSDDFNQLASGFYLKFYVANTTTPLSMATDSTGSATLVKCKLNPDGLPISNPLDNNTVFIPHVNQSYRLVIYRNEDDANADNTAGAFLNVPSLEPLAPGSVSGGVIPYVFDSRDDEALGGQASNLLEAKLATGDYAYTAGKTTPGDGEGQLYEIVDTGGTVTLDNGKQAKIVSKHKTATGTQTVAEMGDDRATSPVSRAELKALDTANLEGKAAILAEGDSGGIFVWRLGDYSSQVTADTEEGFFIKANAVASTVGAWVREAAENMVDSKWYRKASSTFSTSISAAINSLYTTTGDPTGGVVLLPTEDGNISATITINNTAPFSVDGITLKGAGRQTSYFTASGYTGDGVSLGYPIYTVLEDFGIRSTTGSGVVYDSQGGSAGNRNVINRVQSSFNGVDGFTFQRSFLSHLQSSHARSNSGNGFNWNSEVHTSWDISNNYAEKNTAAGFRSEFMVYCALTGNASDENQHGYQFTGARGVHFDANGAEFNGRAGWYHFTSGTTTQNHISMTANLANDNNKDNGGWANHTHLTAADSKPNFVAQKQPVSLPATVAGTKDFIVSGRGAVMSLEDPLISNAGYTAQSDGYLQVNYSAPKLVYQKTFVASGTNKIVGLANSNGLTADYSGKILVSAQNAAFGTTGTIGTATYELLISKSLAGNEVVEVAKVGLTSGTAASHPSFTFAVNSDELQATAVGSTAGDFWFAVEKISGNVVFS